MKLAAPQCPGSQWLGHLCLWVDGDAAVGGRRCVERIAVAAGLRPPFSYCHAHRAVAYVQPEASEEAAVPMSLAA
jgi:hypothetical protein